MAIRFVNTERWLDPWFRKLKPLEKLLFSFLCDRCDLGGFYEIDEEGMAFMMGATREDVLGAIKGLNRAIIVRDGWVWVRKFVEHQRNLPLNPDNNAHKRVIGCLMVKHDLFPEVHDLSPLLGANKGSKYKSSRSKGISKEDVEFVYRAYPTKCPVGSRGTGKGAKDRSKIEALLRKGRKPQELTALIADYVQDCESTGTFMKNFATFLNNLPDPDSFQPTPQAKDQDGDSFNV